ncbi:hypothetical protein [Microbulbifer sp. TRSA005]|uniref:hypothetical protein n=1 Tax=Microbulbifer sp. TRSA005 TaxID=3243383 RepID=UPI0040394F64
MRRKRLNHYADIVCKMFFGWRMSNDLEMMSDLPDGTIFVNILSGEAHHSISGAVDLHIAKQIKSWYKYQSKKDSIDISQLESAILEVDIDTGKVATNKKKIVLFNMECRSTIKTNDKTYKAMIKDMKQWHTRVIT